jgi:hypothetical protein
LVLVFLSGRSLGCNWSLWFGGFQPAAVALVATAVAPDLRYHRRSELKCATELQYLGRYQDLQQSYFPYYK